MERTTRNKSSVKTIIISIWSDNHNCSSVFFNLSVQHLGKQIRAPQSEMLMAETIDIHVKLMGPLEAKAELRCTKEIHGCRHPENAACPFHVLNM